MKWEVSQKSLSLRVNRDVDRITIPKPFSNLDPVYCVQSETVHISTTLMYAIQKEGLLLRDTLCLLNNSITFVVCIYFTTAISLCL